MNVNDRNKLFSVGNIDREDLWPKIVEFEEQAMTFRFIFGLDELPQEPGIILVRGPRQYGKSTWLELELRDTLIDFGQGTAYFINGDELTNEQELENKILELLSMFAKDAKVKRIFIDEITSVENWELALKRLADRRLLKDVLVITTGSKAIDIRRGAERLPGRKGKLDRTDYIFTGVSYKDFHHQAHRELGENTWLTYLLSGGSPIAAKEIWQFGKIPQYFFELIKDWVIGEIVQSGRSRVSLLALMRRLMIHGGSRVSHLKLAKESGLANNTIVLEYVEKLSDLLSLVPSLQWDHVKETPLSRKPAKFNFTNLCVPLTFAARKVIDVYEFKKLPASEKAIWLEWLVAQELFRRNCIRSADKAEELYYWASDEHEIDFVIPEQRIFIEVKHGGASALDFTWFAKTFPKEKLIVINQNEFETDHVKGVTIEQFLLDDGLPRVYLA